MLQFVRVDGVSMSPVLEDGDFVLVRRVFGAVRVGSLVVVKHPELGMLVKRVTARDKRGNIVIAGENPLSTPSFEMGSVPREAVVGEVCFRIARRGGRQPVIV